MSTTPQGVPSKEWVEKLEYYCDNCGWSDEIDGERNKDKEYYVKKANNILGGHISYYDCTFEDCEYVLHMAGVESIEDARADIHDHPELPDHVPSASEAKEKRPDRSDNGGYMDGRGGQWETGGYCTICESRYEDRLATHIPDCPNRDSI